MDTDKLAQIQHTQAIVERINNIVEYTQLPLFMVFFSSIAFNKTPDLDTNNTTTITSAMIGLLYIAKVINISYFKWFSKHEREAIQASKQQPDGYISPFKITHYTYTV